MSKKMKVLISVLVVVLFLGIGGTATVLAQEDEEGPAATTQAEANGLLARVAEILNIPEEDLAAAFEQAQQEMREERWEEAFNQWLDKAVAEGLITQEEAEEIRDWWGQKPDALEPGLFHKAFGSLAPHARNMPGIGWGMLPETMPQPWQGRGPGAWHEMGPEAHHGMLDEALANEFLTEEEAEKLREWLESRPEVSKGVSPQARIFKAMRGRHGMAGWQPGPPWLAD